MNQTTLEVVVIGGGAAGFFGAIACAQHFPDCRVTLLEKSRNLLSKVRVSGGGRCNVTNACPDTRQFAAQYPRGEKPLGQLLKTFGAADTVRWFQLRGVALKTEPDGRMFPVSNQSETIIDCLLCEARNAGVQIRTGCGVKAIESLPVMAGEEMTFRLLLLDGSQLLAHRVLIATGGNPNPLAYEWIQTHQHHVQSPVPSLFTLNAPDSFLLDLPGVAVPDAVVKIAGTKWQQGGAVLLTHWGFSGPAVLRLSAWGARELHERAYRFTLLINWLPTFNEETLRTELTNFRQTQARKLVATQAMFNLPIRLWKKLTGQAEIPETVRWADLPKKNLNRLAELLTRSSFQINGKSTFKEEFVTCGGVSLQDVHWQTMESKRCKGLFFAGEILDIDGITGGFNFQNAWTTGYVAGLHIGKRVEEEAGVEKPVCPAGNR